MKLLLTGRPGVGKTTLVERVVVKVKDSIRCSGFITQEVRAESGARVGFDIVTLDGRVAPLARKGMKEGPRVGDYRVDLKSLERIAVPSIEDPTAQVIVVDEIGLMELKSSLFKDALLDLLGDVRPLLGTIRLQKEPFCDMVKARPGVEVVDVTYDNRDALVEMLAIRLIAAVIPQ
ncbi:MAG: NTPase [Thermoplasmata archaeon]|nr:NTPase [Thermoplasmata archaeon]